MTDSVTTDTTALLFDPDPGKSKLTDHLLDDMLYTLDVTATFKGENIRSVDQLRRKMELLFNNVTLVNLMAVRDGPHTTFKMVVNKFNFLNLICHDNYGYFEDDYELLISNFTRTLTAA